jgi:flagellar basal-body rod protein FlgG
MLRVLNNGRTAMMANQQKLDIISNNIANANTEGYKKLDMSFQDLVYESLDRNGYPITTNGKTTQAFNGTGVKATNPIRDNKQGNLVSTGKNTDLGIDGKGYFEVTMANGQKAYTRNGCFNIDNAGNLVDTSGNIVTINFDGNKQELNGNNFSVAKTGEIYMSNADKTSVRVGTIPTYNAVDGAFTSIGDSLYIPANGANLYEETDRNIEQGVKEISNVDLTTEITDMILTQKAFEMASKSVNVADEMWNVANNLRK